MNITGLKKVLPLLLKNNIVPYLHGAQGIGKTSSIRQYAKENGYKFIPLYLATQEPGDLVGLLHKDESSGTVSHLPPEWIKEAQTGKGIIFLDEFNRAHPDVLQLMFPFVQTGKIHRQSIGEEWKIIVAGNYQNEKFTVTDVSDRALLSRFCHIEIEPEATEFAAFCEENGALVIAEFIRHNPAMLMEDPGTRLDKKSIPYDPRAWFEKVNPLLSEDLGNFKYEVISGCVGQTAAAGLFSFINDNKEKIKMTDILDSFSKNESRIKNLKDRTDLLGNVLDEIVFNLEKNKELLDKKRSDNLKNFLCLIPLEVSMSFIDRIKNLTFKEKNSLFNDVNFIKRYLKQ